jgi:hypothetical protein
MMGWSKTYSVTTFASAAAFIMALWVPDLACADATSDVRDPKAVQGAPTPASQLPPAPANGEMGFVFSDFTPPVYPGWDSCPHGWAATNKEVFLGTVSKAEQTRLLRSENENELTAKWKAYAFGPDNTNVCTNYDKFPNRPLQALVESKIAYGLDLDGDAGSGTRNSDTCTHDSFISPIGEQGIDNQSYRAQGCSRSYRGPDGKDGEIVPGYKTVLAAGEFTVVLLLRGVDSLVNDDDVQVILASSDQQPIVDTKQNFIQNASYHVSDNTRWRNELHGRIVNGVLMTDSKDILLLRARGSRGIAGRPGAGNNWEWDFMRSKLRLAFRPDGSLEGMLGGYEKPLDYMRHEIGGGRGTALTAGIDCASRYNTFMKLADGVRDPKTGQCTRLSSAWRVTASPAFVFDNAPRNMQQSAVEPAATSKTAAR